VCEPVQDLLNFVLDNYCKSCLQEIHRQRAKRTELQRSTAQQMATLHHLAVTQLQPQNSLLQIWQEVWRAAVQRA